MLRFVAKRLSVRPTLQKKTTRSDRKTRNSAVPGRRPLQTLARSLPTATPDYYDPSSVSAAGANRSKACPTNHGFTARTTSRSGRI